MKRLYVYYAMLCMLSVVFCTSCSTMQQIIVEQEQEGQKQKTTINHGAEVKQISMVITPKSITYDGKVYKSFFHPMN